MVSNVYIYKIELFKPNFILISTNQCVSFISVLRNGAVNNALCTALLRANRGQYWKGKQNRILTEKLKEMTIVSNVLY